MRLFIAIDLDEELINKIEGVKDSIELEGTDVKFVEPENLHITLKFLGDVDENDMNQVKETIDNIAKNIHPFTISLEGMGYFGNPNFIRVIWFDVKLGKENIIKIIDKLNNRLNHIRKEKHKPNTHITIGRPISGKNKEKTLHKIQEFSDVKVGEMDVKEIKLKKSILTKNGPIYTDIKTFKIV